MDLDVLTDKIYSHFYGHLDDTEFLDRKTTEIHDWLASGDTRGMTLKSALAEWAEYDADEIAANPWPTPSVAAAALGRKGGQSTSPAKRAASAANGRLGGRPRKQD